MDAEQCKQNKTVQTVGDPEWTLQTGRRAASVAENVPSRNRSQPSPSSFEEAVLRVSNTNQTHEGEDTFDLLAERPFSEERPASRTPRTSSV